MTVEAMALRAAAAACMHIEVRVRKKTEFLEARSLAFLKKRPMRLASMLMPARMNMMPASDL